MWNKIKHLLFQNTSTRQTVAKNSFWLAISNVGGRLTRAMIIIYSARVLGAAEWGIFSYAVSLVSFIAVFTDIGVSPILVRETAKARENPERQREILSTSFYLKIILLALGVLTIIFVAPHFMSIRSGSAVRVLNIVIFILAFDTIREFGFSLVRAIEKMEWEAGLYLATNAAIVVAGFIALYLSKSVVAFTFAYAVGTGLGMVATIWALRREISGILSNFSMKLTKYILESVWPFAVSSFMGILMINTDILVIGWLLSTEDVGLYSAAQRIVQLLYILPSVMNTSLLPTFSRLANVDDKKLRSTFEMVLTFVFLVAAPLAVGGLLLGKEITLFIFGEGFVKSTLSFQILMLTILVDFPVTILTSFVFAYNKQKNLMIFSAIGGISNVIFDLIFIPRFGIAGSAVATFLAQILGQSYLRYTAKKINYFNILPRLKRVFTATTLMILPIVLLNAIGVHVLIIIGAASIAYFGVLLLLKEPVLKEVKLILRPAVSALPAESELLS